MLHCCAKVSVEQIRIKEFKQLKLLINEIFPGLFLNACQGALMQDQKLVVARLEMRKDVGERIGGQGRALLTSDGQALGSIALGFPEPLPPNAVKVLFSPCEPESDLDRTGFGICSNPLLEFFAFCTGLSLS